VLQKTETVETASTEALTETTEEAVVRTDVGSTPQDAEFAELAACIEAGVTRSKRRTHIALNAAVCILLLFAVLALIGAGKPNLEMPLLIFAGALYVAELGLITGLMWSRRDRRIAQESAAAKKLAEMDDVRAVGLLIDAVHWIMKWNPKTVRRPDLWRTLGRLLAHLTEEEAQGLGKERHDLLATWTKAWDTPLFRKHYTGLGNQPLLGMLHALGHVGQNSFRFVQPPFDRTVTLLPLLGKWAAGAGAGTDPAVQQAAVACRDAIKARVALTGPGEHLLRASDPSPLGPVNLLRPAQGTQQTDPQELLRPSDPE
jgi:hypothetical protein